MWIFPVSPEDLAHPRQCADCGAAIIIAKTEKGKGVLLNADFKILETLQFGEDRYLQLLPREASHLVTCEKKAPARPAMTRRGRRKKNVGV